MEKRYSYLWNFFAVSDAVSFKAVCYICNHTLSYRTTITNLKKHLMTRHPEVQIQPNTVVLQEDIADLLSRSAENKAVAVKNDCAKIREKRSSDAALLPNDSSIVKLKKVEPDFTFPRKMNSQTKKLIDSTLLSLFTKDLHKFSLIEGEGFMAFVNALNPQYEIPDLNAISEIILPDLYEKLKQHVDDALQDGLAITLSVDSWTNIFHHEHFIAIKANFLDHNFDVMSVLLDIYCFSEQPTNEKLSEVLRNVTSEWGINEKIALVVSNCIYETTTEGWLQWDYISCVIHSINIIVATSLEGLSDLLLKVQSIVSSYKQNRFATSELLRNQENLGNAPDDLILSNLTDWYSIFSMLKRFVQLEDFIKTTICHLDLSLTFLTKEEWNVCREIVEVIKPFETFIKSLSEEKYLTSSLAIILSKGLETMLKDLSAKPYHDVTHNFLSKCIEETVDQFNSLYSNNILLISTFLDPRFKDVIFEPNVKESLKQSIINIVATNVIPTKEQNISKSEESASDDNSLSIWKAFQSKASQCRPTGAKKNSRASIEIQQYLEDGLLPRNENPMQWWKINGHMYPQLKNLMKQNLAVTCTSVSSDLFFSKLSQTLNERRSRLSIEEAKMILFINSNQYLMKIE